MPPVCTEETSPITGCSCSKFTAECIAGVANAAGFGRDRPTLERAVAIALAESSGRPKIVNSIGCCVGLWQINVKVHKQYSVTAMQDPQQNANAAWAISNSGRNWTPWDAFKNGSYLIYMPAAKLGVDKFYNRNPSNDPNNNALIPDSLEQPMDQLGSLAQYPAMVIKWISDRNNIFRVAKVIMGISIAIVGITIVSRPVFKPVQDAAGKVIGIAATRGKRTA
jgi:hypothetical protein